MNLALSTKFNANQSSASKVTLPAAPLFLDGGGIGGGGGEGGGGDEEVREASQIRSDVQQARLRSLCLPHRVASYRPALPVPESSTRTFLFTCNDNEELSGGQKSGNTSLTVSYSSRPCFPK